MMFSYYILKCVNFSKLYFYSLAPSLPSNIFSSLSPISPPPNKKFSEIFGHLKLTKLKSKKKMGQIINPGIQLLLSMKVERPENLTFEKMKYDFL